MLFIYKTIHKYIDIGQYVCSSWMLKWRALSGYGVQTECPQLVFVHTYSFFVVVVAVAGCCSGVLVYVPTFFSDFFLFFLCGKQESTLLLERFSLENGQVRFYWDYAEL